MSATDSPPTGQVKKVSPSPVPDPMQAIGAPCVRSPAFPKRGVTHGKATWGGEIVQREKEVRQQGRGATWACTVPVGAALVCLRASRGSSFRCRYVFASTAPRQVVMGRARPRPPLELLIFVISQQDRLEQNQPLAEAFGHIPKPMEGTPRDAGTRFVHHGQAPHGNKSKTSSSSMSLSFLLQMSLLIAPFKRLLFLFHDATAWIKKKNDTTERFTTCGSVVLLSPSLAGRYSNICRLFFVPVPPSSFSFSPAALSTPRRYPA